MRCSCQSQLLPCLTACGNCHAKACLNSRKNTFYHDDDGFRKNFNDLLEERFIFENFIQFNALSSLVIMGCTIKLEI